MKDTGSIKVLICYIIFIYILKTAVVFFPVEVANYYLSAAILVMGIAAIVCQKKFNKGKFVEMGFRLNRNVLIGIAISIFFTAIILSLHYLLPLQLDFIEITRNESAKEVSGGMSPVVVVLLIIFIGGGGLFLVCLFGEELTFRGYILPRLEEISGKFKGVILCSIIFGLWHLPAYFSIYSGGAAEEGWTSVAKMVLAHSIATIPICILYLTTRELYGISLYHALADVFQYSIVGNEAMGEMSKDALYNTNVLSETKFEAIGWVIHVSGIIIMLILCRLVKRLTIDYDTHDSKS